VLPWGALLGTLGFNFWQHKHGRPTLCSTGRRFIPAAGFVVAWATFTSWLIPHILNGYPKEPR